MKTIIFTLILLVFTAACNSSNRNNTTITKKTDMENLLVSEIIAPTLLAELKKSISFYDSLAQSGSGKINILEVYFAEGQKGCFMLICPALYYNNRNMNGFIIIDSTMIAFYNLDKNCSSKLVDSTRLEKLKNPKYPGMDADEATPYDGIDRKYEVKKDSLKLVEVGDNIDFSLFLRLF